MGNWLSMRWWEFVVFGSSASKSHLRGADLSYENALFQAGRAAIASKRWNVPQNIRGKALPRPPPVFSATLTPSSCTAQAPRRTNLSLLLPPLPESRGRPPAAQSSCASAVPPHRPRTNQKRRRQGAEATTPWVGPGREGSALASQGRLYK